MPANEEKVDSNKDALKEEALILKELVPAKLSYVTMYTYMGTILSYMNVFFVSVGLSVKQAGFISGLRTIPAIITTPCIGALADFTRKHKMIVLTLIALHVVVTFPLPWIAEFTSNNQPAVNKTSNNLTYSSSIQNIEDDTNIQMFYLMLLMMSLTAVFGIPFNSFVDSAVMILVDKYKSVTSFGKQRVFGPIGFGLGSFLGGLASDHYNHPTLSKYTAVFYLYLVAICLLFISICLLNQKKPTLMNISIDEEETGSLANEKLVLEDNDSKKVKEQQLTKSQRFKVLLSCCRQMRVIFFFIIVAHMGCNFSLVNGYMILHMEHLGSSKTLMGVTIAMASIFEILTFPFSSKIIKLIGGIYPSFCFAVASYAVRFLLMSFIQNPWLFIPVQCFQCFGFAIFWAAAAEHVHHVSSTAISATMFNTVGTLYYCIGNLVGSILGGIIYQNYGGQTLFQGCAVTCTIMTMLVIVFYYTFERKIEDKKELVKKANISGVARCDAKKREIEV